MFYSYPNRTMCDVLDEMRKCDETRNYAQLKSLIEEVQSMGNRMEAALSDKKNIREWTDEREKLKIEMKALRKEKASLDKVLGKDKKDEKSN